MMLPRWHILLGAFFTILIWIFSPQISLFFLMALFLSSILIDFDHYIVSYLNTGKLSLFQAFKYHRKLARKEQLDISRGIRRRSDFHLFHTIEFHVFIGLLGVFWNVFFYVFLGMVFHSLLDLLDMSWKGTIHRREFFFFNWITTRK